MNKKLAAILVALILLFTACGASETQPATDPVSVSESADFSKISQAASGTTVNFYGFGGFQQYNTWVDKDLAALAKEKYNITVNRVGMGIDEVLNLLRNEQAAGKKDGSIDLIWINGENFYAAMEQGLLYGPFADRLPNFDAFIDANAPDIAFDFGTETKFYEAPYGKAQMVLVYESEKITEPPKSAEALLAWAKENPGKFTYAAMPDFTASAFVRNLIHELTDYEAFMDRDLSKEQLSEMMQPVVSYLNELEPYLWNAGKTYPADTAMLNNLYANGEIYMSMSYNPNEATSKIQNGEFSDTTRTFVFDKGMIGNTHFVAIAHNASNKEGAMALADVILSVEAQASKYDPKAWGDMPVLDEAKLTEEQKSMLNASDQGIATLSLTELSEKRIPELPANLVPLIEEIWNEQVANES